MGEQRAERTRQWDTVAVTIADGIAWVALDRPEKRNAMSPAMNRDMIEVLEALETDADCEVLVLTGSGSAFTAGMDIKEYFRETDGEAPVVRERIYRAAGDWQWRRLRNYAKPTIAMVNGWCFGGGFTPLIACDLAIAAEEATFGLSEINWGIIPAGNVAKAITTVLGARDALFYAMTGRTFTGADAARMGLVNLAVPASDLKQATAELAAELRSKNPLVLRHIRAALKNMPTLDWEMSDEYLRAKQDQTRLLDTEGGRAEGMRQFLDEKAFRPGLENYQRTKTS